MTTTCSNCSPAFQSLAALRSLNLVEKSRSNHSLLGAERQELKDVLNNACIELTKYEDAVARLTELIIDLQNERESLTYHVELAQSLLAPVRRLPSEVLNEIFAHNSRENRVIGTPSRRARHLIPNLAASSVCSNWRRVALSMPKLWNNITFIQTSKSCKSSSVLTKMLLERSRATELDVTVRILDSVNEPNDNTQWSFHQLCQHSNRWGKLTLLLWGTQAWATLSSCRGSFSRLKELKLISSPPLPELNDIFETCPQLTSVDLTSVYRAQPSITVPWNQITDVRSVLLNSSVLTSPKLASASLQVMPGASLSPFTSPLKDLTLEIYPGESFDDFLPLLQHATLPDLHTLSLSGQEDDEFIVDESIPPSLLTPAQPFKGFLERSGCRLTSFSITNIALDSTLEHTLAALPALKSFLLENCSTEQAFIQQLIDRMIIRQGSGIALLPRLTSLTLKCSGDSLHDRTLTRMIQSRWRSTIRQGSQADSAHASLQILNLRISSRRFDPDFVQAMLCLRRRGLLMSIQDSAGDIEVR